MQRKRKVSFISLSSQPTNKRGWLYKMGNNIKNWKKRLFVLHENVLHYFASEEDLQPKGTITLTNATVQTSDEVFKVCHLLHIFLILLMLCVECTRTILLLHQNRCKNISYLWRKSQRSTKFD